MATKKKKEFKFFWEAPPKMVTFESMAFPEIKLERTIPVHVSETTKEVIVRAELPGFNKNAININVTESYAEIAAAKKVERVEKTAKSFVQERQAGALRRAFTLPAKVDPDRTEAQLENGVLTIVMQKLHPEQKKRRRIDVK